MKKHISLRDKRVWGHHECNRHGIQVNIVGQIDISSEELRPFKNSKKRGKKPFVFKGIPRTSKDFERCLTPY